MTELRVYLPILDLQPQFAAYLSSPTRARGYPVYAGEHSLIVEVTPALSIHRIADLALKASPDLEPGILFTERQFGLLELHSSIESELESAGKAILDGISAKPSDQLLPKILYRDIIENIADQHSIILNRTRSASMLISGSSLLVCEMSPALFACKAANEAERAAPQAIINDVQMIGASGRVFMSGRKEDLVIAQSAIDDLIKNK